MRQKTPWVRHVRLIIYSYLSAKELVYKIEPLCKEDRIIIKDSVIAREGRVVTLSSNFMSQEDKEKLLFYADYVRIECDMFLPENILTLFRKFEKF